MNKDSTFEKGVFSVLSERPVERQQEVGFGESDGCVLLMYRDWIQGLGYK